MRWAWISWRIWVEDIGRVVVVSFVMVVAALMAQL